MPGKVSPDDLLTHVFGRTGETDETVIQGPADGEDAAAIDWPGGTLVVSSDPISLAASQVGTLGVHIACNDVAASGADPRWLTVVLLLPTGTGSDALEAITTDLDAAAREVGATVVGGHSEYVDALERPLLSLTAMGATESFVPTGGAEPGDRVVLTKAAGLEGTAILASDFGEDLDVSEETCERARSFFEEISVVPDARVLREHATAMHDPTEGGVVAGLVELARASDVRLEVDRDAVPIRGETRELCAAADVDPLRIFGSGSLLATVPAGAVEETLDALGKAGLEAAVIGEVTAGREAGTDADTDTDTGSGGGDDDGNEDRSEFALLLDGETITEHVEDDLYPLWAAADEETN